MTKHQIVICQNDYPIGVLPAGASHEDASVHCAALAASSKREREREKEKCSGGLVQLSYFHWHEVPVEMLS